MKAVLRDNGYKRRWGLRCSGDTARAGAHLEGSCAESVWLRPGGDGGVSGAPVCPQGMESGSGLPQGPKLHRSGKQIAEKGSGLGTSSTQRTGRSRSVQAEVGGSSEHLWWDTCSGSHVHPLHGGGITAGDLLEDASPARASIRQRSKAACM